MSTMATAGWTELLAGALAHDIGNLAHGLSSAQRLTRGGVGEDFDVTEWAAFVESDVNRLRKLGLRLRALATAGATNASARLDDACTAARAEVDPGGAQVRHVHAPEVDARARGTAAAVSTAVVSLLEHALAASPAGAPIELAVRVSAGGTVIVEVAAPEASSLRVFARARLDAALETALRDRRGDLSLVLSGAVADALGGAVYVSSDSKRGLVLELQLVAASS